MGEWSLLAYFDSSRDKKCVRTSVRLAVFCELKKYTYRNLVILLGGVKNRGDYMQLKKSLALLSASILSIGILAACSSDSSSTSEPKKDVPADGNTVIKIATQTPLSGGSAIIGESIRLGAQ